MIEDGGETTARPLPASIPVLPRPASAL